MPAGYPVFLKGLWTVSSSLAFTMVVQHLVGMATAALLYASAKRLGARSWVALSVAGVVLFSGDHIYLEHSLMAECVYTGAIALGLLLFRPHDVAVLTGASARCRSS